MLLSLGLLGRLLSRVYWDKPEGGGGSSDGGGGDEDHDNPPPTPDEKKYTKTDVERLITDRLKKLTREKKASDDALAALKAEFEQFKATHSPPAPEDKTASGEAQIQIKRLEKLVEDQGKLIAEERKKREAAEAAQAQSHRDQLVVSALTKAKCRDIYIGQQVFSNRVIFDEDTETWLFKSKDGPLVSIESGIDDELPDYLRDPKMLGGGSGSSATTKLAAKRQALENAEKELARLANLVKSSGSESHALATYSKQKKVVAQLKSELS